MKLQCKETLVTFEGELVGESKQDYKLHYYGQLVYFPKLEYRKYRPITPGPATQKAIDYLTSRGLVMLEPGHTRFLDGSYRAFWSEKRQEVWYTYNNREIQQLARKIKEKGL